MHMDALFGNDNDLATFVTCSIYVHDFTKYFANTSGKWLKLCMMRDSVLTVRLERFLQSRRQALLDSIVPGLRPIWEEADISGSFTACHDEGHRWFVAKRLESSTLVHYNIFTGCLLVGGKPLSTLPDEYPEHSLYKQVFGDRLLDVVASNDSRFTYMTSNMFEGHQLYLGFDNESLRIASKCAAQSYAAVSKACFSDTIPTRILEECVPWLDLQSGRIEFRSHRSPWCLLSTDWILEPMQLNTYTMQTNTHNLLDNHGTFGRTVCQILSPIESTDFIHITQAKTSSAVISVMLPRYNLSFVVKKSLLYCNELAAIVDPEQAIGTLHGLQNRLVFKSTYSAIADPKRWVVVPFGEVSTRRNEHHIHVEVDISDYDYLTYYKYSVDSTLGTLSADQIEAHFYKSYLHALTSSREPDTFTKRTGLEESFTALKDSLVWTCVPFSVESQVILECIANLSPARSYYPDTEARHMQTVVWNENLSYLTQHDLFFETVQKITLHNHEARFLYPDDVHYTVPAYRGNDEDLRLAHRAKWTWQRYWRASFIADEPQPKSDLIYDSRDQENSRDTSAVYRISRMIIDWLLEACDQVDIFAMLTDLGQVSGFQSFFVSVSLTDSLSAEVQTSWPCLLNMCLRVSDMDSRAELLFCLSLLAFSNPDSLHLLTVLAFFAILPELAAVGPPTQDEYQLSAGCQIRWKLVQEILDSCRYAPNVEALDIV